MENLWIKNRPVDNHSPQNSVISGMNRNTRRTQEETFFRKPLTSSGDARHQNRRGYALKLGPCLGKLWGPGGWCVGREKGAPARHDSDSETL